MILLQILKIWMNIKKCIFGKISKINLASKIHFWNGTFLIEQYSLNKRSLDKKSNPIFLEFLF